MVDICSDYYNRFRILFNSSKSQTTVFGGRSPPHFVVKLNEAPVPYVDTVKYLGVFINSRTNCVDSSAALRNFFGCFNNNMSVLRYGRDKMSAVFLAKTYWLCLPILLYGCETWRKSSSDKHKFDVAWNNCFRIFLMLVGAKVLNRCYFTVVLCLFHYS